MERPSQKQISDFMFMGKNLKPKTPEYLVWEQMFKMYNADPNNRPVGMGCSPCYHKVYDYLQKKQEEFKLE